jgi:hypothetical protein
MDLKYKFNAKEYATLNGISASALRKRRLAGKLDGQFVKKGSEYFYAPPAGDRPNKEQFTVHGSRLKTRRRNVPGSCTLYHNARNGHQLKLANDIKQLARINRRLSEEQIAEITDDIFEVAKQRRVERLKKATEVPDYKIQKNYGRFINCSILGYTDVKTKWRPLFPKAKDEYDDALEDASAAYDGKYY